MQVVHPEDMELFLGVVSLENILYQHANQIYSVECEFRIRETNRDYYWICASLHLIDDLSTGDIKGFCYIENIHERKVKEENLIYKSMHDDLTGFLNKSSIEAKISYFIQSNEAMEDLHAFMVLDIDFFKNINDTFGHAFGDDVIRDISSKLSTHIRKDDLVGRIGGDEFIILVKSIKTEMNIIKRANEILDIMNITYENEGKSLNVSGSIGITCFSGFDLSYLELYKTADKALYKAKEKGKNRFEIIHLSK